LTLTGSNAIDGLGNSLANVLIGNGAANRLNGAGAADTMAGMAGDDIYVVDHLLDKAVEAAGAGTDTVQSSASFILGANVEHLTLTGAGALDGTGNALANTLTGNAGANKLRGGAGDDTIDGGGGSDRLYGGLGDDVLTGGAGNDGFWFDSALGASNVDSLADFNPADDSIQLSRAVFTAIAASGPLSAAAFQAGPAALDPSDRILYDGAAGRIFYDADGSGAAAAILFATVAPGTALTHADFIAY
jgi:Ca2+-binding RTX toxin-like protein